MLQEDTMSTATASTLDADALDANPGSLRSRYVNKEKPCGPKHL